MRIIIFMFGACAVQLLNLSHTRVWYSRMRYIYKAYSEVVHGYCSAHVQYVLRRLDASSACCSLVPRPHPLSYAGIQKGLVTFEGFLGCADSAEV